MKKNPRTGCDLNKANFPIENAKILERVKVMIFWNISAIRFSN